MATSHPVFQQMLAMKCSDKRAAPVAFAVYMDLAEVQVLWDLQCAFCEDLDIIYITGKNSETDPEPGVYVPLPASRNISPAWLQRVQSSLAMNSRSLTLAFKDADSTVVYYLISEGLVSPDSPETVQTKKLSEEKRRLLKSELWRKRNQLFEAAKHNVDRVDMSSIQGD